MLRWSIHTKPILKTCGNSTTINRRVRLILVARSGQVMFAWIITLSYEYWIALMLWTYTRILILWTYTGILILWTYTVILMLWTYTGILMLWTYTGILMLWTLWRKVSKSSLESTYTNKINKRKEQIRTLLGGSSFFSKVCLLPHMDTWLEVVLCKISARMEVMYFLLK